uniref:Uncharacterized protein n=1 Tax=Anguilla anguilla TaxID=7936 RepID=A0A0E9W884_ANGAN
MRRKRMQFRNAIQYSTTDRKKCHVSVKYGHKTKTTVTKPDVHSFFFRKQNMTKSQFL